MIWPDNADGGCTTPIGITGFDFSEPCWVDFNIDFENWPPPDAVVEEIKNHFPEAVSAVEEDREGGCVLIRIFDMLSYEFVISVQDKLSKIAAPFRGRCESWGVFH